jgi:cobalt-zinc-cadmium efflux system membrane fusion protein
MVELLAGLAPGDSAVVQGGFELMSAATASSRSAEHGH